MEAEIWSFQTVPLTILGGKLKYYGSERFFNLRCPFRHRHERAIIGCELNAAIFFRRSLIGQPA